MRRERIGMDREADFAHLLHDITDLWLNVVTNRRGAQKYVRILVNVRQIKEVVVDIKEIVSA